MPRGESTAHPLGTGPLRESATFDRAAIAEI